MRRATFCVALVFASVLFAQPADQQAGKVVLFGAPHAHSSLSDDAVTLPGNQNLHCTPASPSPRSRARHGLNFLGVSDHQKATDSNQRLFMTRDEYRVNAGEYIYLAITEHNGNDNP